MQKEKSSFPQQNKAVLPHTALKVRVCVSVCFGIYKQNDNLPTQHLNFRHQSCTRFSLSLNNTSFPHNPLSLLPLTVNAVFFRTSVRDHAVHLVGQLVLEARDGLAGSAGDEVGRRALHVVHTQVTRLRDLTLRKVHELRVPGVDAETLGDQDLM